MTRCMSAMGYDAMALGDADFGIGWQAVERLKETAAFPMLSANLVRGEGRDAPLFAEPYTIIEIGGPGEKGKVGVIGLSHSAEFGKLTEDRIDDLRALDPIESLGPVLEEVSAVTERFIVLSNLTRAEDIALAAAHPEIDIIIGSEAPLFQMAPVFVRDGEASFVEYEGDDPGEGTLIVTSIDKGRGLGVLGVRLDEEGTIRRFVFEQAGISPDDHEEDPHVAALLLSYSNTLRKSDAREALDEWDRLVQGDYSHLRNLDSVLALGEQGREAYEKGNYSEALGHLEAAKDSLLMRESAGEAREEFEELLAQGTPEGLGTDKLMDIFEGAKKLFRERHYAEAKQQFRRASWNLRRMHRVDELFENYLRGKDLFLDDGIDVSMTDEQLKSVEEAIDEEKWGEALGVLQGVTLRITRGKNIRKWRKVTGSLVEELGNEVPRDTLVERTLHEADSAYLAGSFPTARVKYMRLAKILEPLAQERETPVETGPVPAGTGNRYVGSARCRECHTAAYEQWETTLHARAYVRLEEESRGDPACVRCHVVGFGSDDGFRIDEPDPLLAEVGCEACHGRGYLHTQDTDPASIRSGYDRMNCRRCHDPSQGFGFDYYPALIRVMH